MPVEPEIYFVDYLPVTLLHAIPTRFAESFIEQDKARFSTLRMKKKGYHAGFSSVVPVHSDVRRQMIVLNKC